MQKSYMYIVSSFIFRQPCASLAPIFLDSKRVQIGTSATRRLDDEIPDLGFGMAPSPSALYHNPHQLRSPERLGMICSNHSFFFALESVIFDSLNDLDTRTPQEAPETTLQLIPSSYDKLRLQASEAVWYTYIL